MNKDFNLKIDLEKKSKSDKKKNEIKSKFWSQKLPFRETNRIKKILRNFEENVLDFWFKKILIKKGIHPRFLNTEMVEWRPLVSKVA